ncbi:hypothetical protein ABUE31_13695 [Mesorhizobium sp. ZMM04-5]|uniref:Uncharacterized protein n=1 Tax=Mesorhizobium marinum TaxID=3228790 RepID=A0ABV3R1X4_9HYPH
MLRELSEDVRILVKDRLRDFRSIVRQHRHDHAPGQGRAADANGQPLPVRGIEGLLGHAASAFDDVMTIAEGLAPRPGAGGASRSGPQPLQSYFRGPGDATLDGERAFRRDLYRLAKLALVKNGLSDFRILESDFAAVHEKLEKGSAGPIARLHAQTERDERIQLVAALCASLFVELVRKGPVRLAPVGADGSTGADGVVASNALAAIAIACGLATLDMEGAPAAELMEIASLAVGARGDRIRAALDGDERMDRLTALFAGLLTHLN